ncbi:MAG: hypothetical protein BMS9Abin37_2043 [Acidobacteriota bacterium]|nr:MAG: hypothetical protein BMS9Abin37_2043 [Acidobacteriota bacterium]
MGNAEARAKMILSPGERERDNPDRPRPKGALVRVIGPYFVAGLIVHRKVVVGSAPILRYMVTWDWTDAQRYIEKRGWDWVMVQNSVSRTE